MAFCRAAQHSHDHLLMIRRHVGGFMNRGDFELSRSNFVVASFCRNSEPVQLVFYVLHIDLNTFRNCTEVMIIKLLPLG